MLKPHNPNAFTRSPLDRAAHLRGDAAWQAAARVSSEARLAAFHRLRPLVAGADSVEVAWLRGGHAHALVGEAPMLFLGLDREGAPHFAFEVEDAEAARDLGRFEELRGLGAVLSSGDLAMLGCARAIFEWHAKNKFCANCGAPSLVAESGWKRQCPACQREHFPRVDPVVIMLPVHGDACLLGRQRAWPRGMVSALAGFVEPGEAIEEAVARETLEEAGLIVREVRLHSTQPWPFPHSLMIGAICDVAGRDLRVDESELESARWFTLDEARALLAGELSGWFCPPPFAIAHQLLKAWVEAA